MLPFLSLAVIAVAQAPAQDRVDVLQVNPLLLVQAEEVWSVIGRKDNPVWPGWDARKTPVLIYFPGKQDLLVNHPRPPAGFRKYNGPLRSSIGPMFVRDGATLFDLDGQNTSTDVSGLETLVIADTLSTRRQWVQGIAGEVAADPDGSKDLIGNGLFSNPFDSMVMFAHEAFHVYQRKQAPNKGGREMTLVNYPSLSVDNNAGYALEADLLAAALQAKTDAEAREIGVRWLAARQHRRSFLAAEAVAYEDGTEFNEGLAKYTEYRILQCLQGKKPAREMWLVQGFRGYADLTAERARLVRQMQGFMTGTSGVNNDLYGASPVRFRLYYSGMAVAALLDRLGAKWHSRIFAPNVSLTGLAAEALHAKPSELETAQRLAERSERYVALLAEKRKLAEDGEAYIKEQVAKFDEAPGELVLDYSGLKDAEPAFGFTPFGILRIDNDRNMFRLVPIRGNVGNCRFAEEGTRPVIYDRKEKVVRFPLTKAPNGTPSGMATDLQLPGVRVTGVKGRVVVDGKRVVVHLVD